MVAPAYFEEDETLPRAKEEPHTARNIAPLVWGICATILLLPSFFVWIIRGVALATDCAPGPELCHGMMLGGGLHDALELSWFVSSNIIVILALALTATVAGLFIRRPVFAASGLLLLPLFTLMLPMSAVYSSQYGACIVSINAAQDCMLWGASMGDTFRNAARIPGIIFSFAPYSFALAIMLGVLGWFLTRPRAPAQDHSFSDRGH